MAAETRAIHAHEMKTPRTILAVDPGNERTALIWWQDRKIIRKGIYLNQNALCEIDDFQCPSQTGNVIVCEMIASYGMAVGASVFETCVWIGRFWQTTSAGSWRAPFHRIFRREVKLHLCGSMRAKDGNIRQALIDRLGPPGTKKNPGATYGISKDLWAALAVAVTYDDLNPE